MLGKNIDWLHIAVGLSAVGVGIWGIANAWCNMDEAFHVLFSMSLVILLGGSLIVISACNIKDIP